MKQKHEFLKYWHSTRALLQADCSTDTSCDGALSTKQRAKKSNCSSCAFGFRSGAEQMVQWNIYELRHHWTESLETTFAFLLLGSQMNCHCSPSLLQHTAPLASDMQFEPISLSRQRPSSARFPLARCYILESSSFDVLFVNKLGRNSDGNLAARGWLGGRCVIINFIWWHGSERVHFWLRFFAPASQLLVQLTSGVNKLREARGAAQHEMNSVGDRNQLLVSELTVTAGSIFNFFSTFCHFGCFGMFWKKFFAVSCIKFFETFCDTFPFHVLVFIGTTFNIDLLS